MAGRPLRFLVVLLGGWAAGRTVALWPTVDTAGELVREVFTGRPASAATATLPSMERRVRIALYPHAAPGAEADLRSGRSPRAPPDASRIRLALLGFLSLGTAEEVAAETADLTGGGETRAFVPVPAARPVPVTLPSRWSGSGWLLARGAGGAGIAPGGGQIGGSQGGMRLGYAIDPARRLTVVGRLAAPLAGIGREASVGIEWQPTRLPLRLVAERRVAVDGGRGGFGAGLIAGLPPTPLPLGFRLEGYGQAGAIRRIATEPYADGALRLTRPVAELAGLRLDLGLGLWGAAQRDAQRLDLGPSLGVTAPLGERILRLSLDWRQRVAGHAAPGSGPALTLGSDF